MIVVVNNKALVRAGAPFQLQLGYGKVTRGRGTGGGGYEIEALHNSKNCKMQFGEHQKQANLNSSYYHIGYIAPFTLVDRGISINT